MRGRKPKPTALKLAEGNRGKGRRPSGENEPKPDSSLPECPEHLDSEARRECWRVSKHLHDCGLLTGVDRAGLAAYCVVWSRWIEAETDILERGLLVRPTAGSENWVQNPLLSVANRCLDQIRAFLTEFGMTPASRGRISIDNPVSARDEFERILSAPRSD